MKNKVTLYATITADGYIADINGEENIFSEANWEVFKNLAISYKNVIWGRKTYEMVVNWGEHYINDFDNINIIVISTSNKDYKKSNVLVANSLEEAIDIAKQDNLVPFIGGGSFTYSKALNKDLVNEIILNYNSIFIGNGIKLFNNINRNEFLIDSTRKINDNILQMILRKI